MVLMGIGWVKSRSGALIDWVSYSSCNSAEVVNSPEGRHPVGIGLGDIRRSRKRGGGLERTRRKEGKGGWVDE